MTNFALGFRDGRDDARRRFRGRIDAGRCNPTMFGGERPISGCVCPGCCEARCKQGEYGRGYAVGYAAELHKSDRAASACGMCNRVADAGFGPSHNGSKMCRLEASIASGGNVAHCTCAGCY